MLKFPVGGLMGLCENCGFKALLYVQAMMIRPSELDILPDDDNMGKPLPNLNVCPTCYETPAGIVSENLRHKRLPDEEYKHDAKTQIH